jgi:hypothetical protein
MTSKITTGGSKSGFATGVENRASCRFWRKPFLRMAAVLVGLGIFAHAQWLPAQTNSTEPIYPANRYLLVVETSQAMQRHTNALVQIVRQVVGSAIGAQAHRGDTLGVWTFNEDVIGGVLPLQRWSKGNAAAITNRVASFLRAQKYEKVAHLDKVFPAMDRLKTNSEFITVIVVCLGDTDIQGTPFDATINQFLRIWRTKEQDAGAPFVIALRGQAGTFVDYKLNPSPWPAELPALPKELLTPLKRVQPVAVVTNKPPVPTVPPLIVSGHKHETTQANASAVPATPVTSTGSGDATNAPTPLPVSPPAVTKEGAQAVVTAVDTGSISKLAGDPRPAATAHGGDTNSSLPTVTTPPATPTNSLAVEKVRDPRPAPAPAMNAAVPQTAEALGVPPSQSRHLALIVTGVVSLMALLGAVILWRARPRRTTDTSIITESFDRRKE